MKKVILLLTWYFVNTVSAYAFSQGVTLDVKNSPISNVFKEIERQTNYEFIYPSEELYSKRISISVVNEKIEEVMKICLRGLPFDYYINGNRIVVSKLNISNSAENMLTGKGGYPIDLSGRVVNQKGEPIVGATIAVKGTDFFSFACLLFLISPPFSEVFFVAVVACFAPTILIVVFFYSGYLWWPFSFSGWLV